jgi:pimeloyl-ACP methyl ester carboxylesterase
MATAIGPDERERTRALIPNARMVTLKDIGHFSAVENPSELADIILQSWGSSCAETDL